MKLSDLHFCPKCGQKNYTYQENLYWLCPSCGFTYFHNVAVSASLILRFKDSILLLKRAKEPQKGLFCLPGGFVNPDERAEAAAMRECFEETGLASESLSFVGSWPNDYNYKEVPYKTCDLFFSAQTKDFPDVQKLDPIEISTFILVPIQEIQQLPIAFESHRLALQIYIKSAGLHI